MNSKSNNDCPTDDGNRVQIYYPLWMKILGVVGLPALTFAGIYLASMPVWETDLTHAQLVLLPLFGLAVLYQCYFGFHCLPHLNTVVTILDDGVEVQKLNSSNQHLWPDLKVQTFLFATTTRIFTNDGSTLVYFSDSVPNLKLLVPMIVVEERE